MESLKVLQAKAEAEAKRKADAEAKAKAEDEAQRKAAEAALQAQIAAEDAPRNQSIIGQLCRAHRRPGAAQLDSAAEQPRRPVLRGAGAVDAGRRLISVQIVQSSGHAAFDRSVEAAVFRAAPLPLPPDPGLFEIFRNLQFRFTPK